MNPLEKELESTLKRLTLEQKAQGYDELSRALHHVPVGPGTKYITKGDLYSIVYRLEKTVDLKKATELYPMLRFFEYSHLPKHLQDTSKVFFNAAYDMVHSVPVCDETKKGLDKLLEAKDCFVRACIPKCSNGRDE